MKLISTLSSFILASGQEHFDDGSPSLLQLRSVHEASPEHAHSHAEGHHYGYNASHKLSGHTFGCTGREQTPGDVITCGLWGDVHQHLKYSGGGAANSNGIGWYWLAKSKEGVEPEFQAQGFYRQHGGWTTLSHFVFKFGDQVLFLDRELQPDNSDGRSESWLWKYYWDGEEKSVEEAPCEVGNVYWANRGRGHLANDGNFGDFSRRAAIRNSCFEFLPSVSIWVSYQTWQRNSLGPYGGGGIIEIEGARSYLDENKGQCAFAQEQVHPTEMLVTVEQNNKVCDDNKLQRHQCADPDPPPPSPPPEPTAEELCATAAQGDVVGANDRYEHAQDLCAGQLIHGQDVYDDCLYDVCASWDAAAEQLAVGGAELAASMFNTVPRCQINPNTFDEDGNPLVSTNCRPCNICSAATEVNLRHVTHSNLGGVGPDSGAEEIRYKNAICLGGTLVFPDDGGLAQCPDGRLLDVALTAIPNEGGAYDLIPNKVTKNGNNEKEPEPFGRFLINSGLTSDLKFEFQDSATGEAVPVPDITLTFYDMDEAEQQYGNRDRVQRETITACHAAEIYVTEPTELIAETEGLCHSFTSSVVGTGADNPKTPGTLTMAQAQRSVTYEFHKKAHIMWTATVTAGANTPRPILFSFRPQVACGASDSETQCADAPGA